MLNEELFAQTTDGLLRGEQPSELQTATIGRELAIVRRLRETAGEGVPDPEFVLGLREELRLRAQARSRPVASESRFALLDTALGTLALAYRNGSVLCCSLVAEQQSSHDGRPSVDEFVRSTARLLGSWPERDLAPPPALERAVRDHLAGRKRFTSVDLSPLPEFQRRVLEKTAQIPRGEVRPYGWVAREIGQPGATRAVGTALGHNPIPFLIPCHRVVRSDGSLGEYSGGGPAAKRRVLEQEGVPLDELIAAARAGQRYRGSSTTRIVCYPSCHAARRMQAENVVPFATLAQAQARGYRPCALCRPA